jgi:hypothetical protein
VKTYKEREREREREREKEGGKRKGGRGTRGTVGLVHHYSPKLNFSQWFV